MSTTVSDFVIDRIKAWGVSRVFGYPGDGIGPSTVPSARRTAASERSSTSVRRTRRSPR
jgi:pyruvate dehydrogenase (quinone)